jgi:hypothetical protein
MESSGLAQTLKITQGAQVAFHGRATDLRVLMEVGEIQITQPSVNAGMVDHIL